MENEILKLSDTGIFVLDIYDKSNLSECLASIPSNDITVISNNPTNSYPQSEKVTDHKVFSSAVSMATLRNYALHQSRIEGYKHIFIISSNQKFTDEKVLENIKNIAENFGVYFITGNVDNAFPIEDDVKNLKMNFSADVNFDFIYIRSVLIKAVGFFDERFFNTKDLDVYDYIERLREKALYPPHRWFSSTEGMETIPATISKKGFLDYPDQDYGVKVSYGYFMHKHKHIPFMDERKSAAKEELLKTLEFLQSNYGRKE